MKTIIKKLVAGLLSASILLTGAVIASPTEASTVEAASKNAFKNLNVSWDIKPEKTVPVYTKVYGMDKLQKMKGTITNYKKSSKNGTTTVKFRVNMENTYWNVSSDAIKKMVQDDIVGGGFYWAVMDYSTGKELSKGNKYGVNVIIGDWKVDENAASYYYADDESYAYFPILNYANVKITYPSDYENLCIAIGGSTSATNTEDDNAFWDGTKSFKNTTYYSSKNKKVAHIMRVDGEGNYKKK